MTPLPFRSPLAEYEKQAEQLLDGWGAGDQPAIELFHHHLPRFLDERIPWKPKDLSAEELRSATINREEARLALARSYGFLDWCELARWVVEVCRADSPVARFESAVEAVVNGDAVALRQLLQQHPDLVRVRSTYVTPHDPPMHRATLLHYVAANGVEGWRQKTPGSAVEIAEMLLDAGAEPDALAEMYGGECTTMSMLVSSSHPAAAGLQSALAETLIDHGASVARCGKGAWTSPLATALAFGYTDTARTLVRRGAVVDSVDLAAGLGDVEQVRRLLPAASTLERHRALALAAQHGHVEVLKVMLDAGEDPNRYNPDGNHGHSTPLHQAVWAGHEDAVRLLVERGARLDIRDTIWNGTALGWAEHGSRAKVAEFLRGRGATRGN
jgi:ankyrin repeat protein